MFLHANSEPLFEVFHRNVENFEAVLQVEGLLPAQGLLVFRELLPQLNTQMVLQGKQMVVIKYDGGNIDLDQIQTGQLNKSGRGKKCYFIVAFFNSPPAGND